MSIPLPLLSHARRIPLTEILGLESVGVSSLPWCYKFYIITFKRSRRNPSLWIPRRVALRFRLLENCLRWRSAIMDELRKGAVREEGGKRREVRGGRRVERREARKRRRGERREREVKSVVQHFLRRISVLFSRSILLSLFPPMPLLFRPPPFIVLPCCYAQTRHGRGGSTSL